MKSFVCPCNSGIHIIKECPINECPFHAERVSELFEVPDIETKCIFYDTDLMANVSDSRTQISALSRDKRRKVSPKVMRGIYEDALKYIKTAYDLTHRIVSNPSTCTNCGYPTANKLDCASRTLCDERKQWVEYVLSRYSINFTLSKAQLVWELLFNKEIHLEEKARERGVSYVSSKDIKRFKA